MSRIAVAMSGGVDSSVTAGLLVREGHDVRGVTMRLLSRADVASEHAARVCGHLGIPHRTVDLSEAFGPLVVEEFADAYASGVTPNPCVRCNDLVKFGLLLEHVIGEGAEAMATGHYARMEHGRLLRADGEAKDQSYFLYRLGPRRADRVMFPLGGMTKPVVRETAADMGLHVSDRPESQEACFAGDDRYVHVVRALRPDAFVPGPIVLEDGTVVGEHAGIAGFTIGQRKGLGVAGPHALYVIAVEPATRRIVVGPKEAAESRSVVAGDVVWWAPERSGRCTFKHRSAGRPAEGVFEFGDDGRLRVDSDAPLEGVARGQALVCYDGPAVLGGGTIESAT